MRSLGRYCLIALALLSALLLVAGLVISLQPDTFSVQRSATMAAPPARVFALVNDLRAWDGWSPWKGLDPNAKVTFATPPSGTGATFTWDGNDAIGAGRLTILDSRPAGRVEVEQAFVRPFAGKARMAFAFAAVPGGTEVTWKMDGTNDFIGKAMCLVVDMDARLGKDFAQGLANMKTLVEQSDAVPPANTVSPANTAPPGDTAPPDAAP